MSLRAIKYENNTLEILDQLLLPAQSKYIQVKGVEDGWKVINKMQVSCYNTAPVHDLDNLLAKGEGGTGYSYCWMSQFGSRIEK